MDSKKSPKGRKRSAKGGPSISTSLVEEHYWDCSVCTFRNNAEAFKCSMCDVRKGTSTRKPRLNPDLVAQQQAQALTPPPASLLAGSSAAGSSSEAGPSSTGVKSPASVEDEEMGEEEEEDETDLAALASLKANKRLSKEKPVKEKKKELKKEIKKESKKPINKAKLKNVDRNSATYHSVTVNDFTVVITEFKPKIKKEKDKKESKAHGQANPGSTNSSSSSPTSSAANTPAPASLTNSIDKQLNGNNSNSFESAVHGSTNINSASGNTNTLSVDKDKNRVPSPNDPVLDSSEGIKDRQPVLAAALQSPLKYTGSSTKLNLLGTSRSSPNSLSSSEQDVPPHISTSRPPAISSSTHYPHGGVHPPPRPHPHHHQLSPNPNKMSNHSKLQGNDRHPLPGYPHARPSQTPPSSIPSTNKSTPGVLSPTNNIKGSSSNSTSGPTSRASSASSSVSSVSSSSPASTLASSTHRHSSSSGNSANGSMTSPKNSNLSRNT